MMLRIPSIGIAFFDSLLRTLILSDIAIFRDFIVCFDKFSNDVDSSCRPLFYEIIERRLAETILVNLPQERPH